MTDLEKHLDFRTAIIVSSSICSGGGRLVLECKYFVEMSSTKIYISPFLVHQMVFLSVWKGRNWYQVLLISSVLSGYAIFLILLNTLNLCM